MKVLDICSGLGGFSEAFIEDDHEVLRLDNDIRFKDVSFTEIKDVMDLKDISDYDIILASPPCQAFSVASIGHHWTGGNRAYEPKTEFAKYSIKLVKKIVELVTKSNSIYFIENPRGVLRKLKVMKPLKRMTVTYCQYGDIRMKPTDIWTNSKEWRPKPMCKNGAPCHESAPRGAKTGTQGLKNSALRALIPKELSAEILRACELEMNGGTNRKHTLFDYSEDSI